jgi:hypothetical protein
MASTKFPARNYPEYPIHTTANRTPTAGLPIGYTVYNETSKKLELWNGTLWYGFDGSLGQGVVPWAPDAFTFTGGNVSSTQIAAVGKSMANASAQSTPTAGGTLTIDGVSLGSYDYVIKSGSQTVSSFTNSDWFTTTADTRSAFVVVQGDLSISSGQTFIPTNRKLFTCIYVTGNLTVSGTISMAGRGASHSATAAGNIRIANGTYSSIVNPAVPAAGGAAVASSTNGTAGANGGTGSGGGGQNDNVQAAPHGAAGTSFSGGAGGGGGRTYGGIGTPNGGGAGAANGGAGGNALAAGGPYPTANPSSGGSGNPAGSGGENPGGTGTGGVLFIFVEGTISGAGSITVNGVNPGSASERPGAGSGGGSCTVLYSLDTSTVTPTATGGQGNGIYGATTNGGTGTARKLAIG